MLRSLYAGVSGLRSHQSKLDVLGNNISNVNTVGFKGGRIVFSEALNQTLARGSKNSGTGFLNPAQVGLGVQVSSVDRMFSQGALENTGNVTDLAIEGEGFFVLRGGDRQLFTRAGNFYLDANGNFVNQNGLRVQGWMLTGDQEIINYGASNLQDIVLDSNISSKATATKNVWLSGNLNAGLTPDAQVWSSSSAVTTKATVTGTPIAGAVNVVAGTNDTFAIELSGGSAAVSESLTLTAGAYADAAALVAEINTQIAANANLAGNLEAIVDGGAVKLRSLDNNSNAVITVRSGANDVLGDLGFSTGDTGSAGSDAAINTELNDLLQTTTNMVAGDTIEIRGTNPDGSAVTATFTYGTDGTAVQDLLTVINATFTGTTATFTDGQIVMTDTVPGDSESSIYLTNGTANTGGINIPGFANTVPGFTGRSSTSVVVYDSLGDAHNLIIEFTKTANAGEWTWDVTTSGDESVIGGGTGRAVFNEFGVLTSFTYDNNASQLVLDPGNDAANILIDLNPSGDKDFSGLTQFASNSTLNVREQDGRTNGELQGLLIDERGVLTGTFSNGETRDLARLAMAQFGNNHGLVDLGDGLNEESVSSGEADIFSPDGNQAVSIVSGALELSNVDLSKEFTELIVAQRGFQANAKVITTADTIIDEVIRIKR